MFAPILALYNAVPLNRKEISNQKWTR